MIKKRALLLRMSCFLLLLFFSALFLWASDICTDIENAGSDNGEEIAYLNNYLSYLTHNNNPADYEGIGVVLGDLQAAWEIQSNLNDAWHANNCDEQ